ncbi:MAG: hypothetical protein JSW27_11815 [Phycisphaerales bacterium]|nr:MAG: hypothetical protein JSW27_11815 [Phycisphaerales bacterium]
MDVKGRTVKGCRALLGRLGLAVFVTTSCTATSIGLAQGDPNATASEPIGVSDINIATVQEILNRIYISNYTVNGTRRVDLVIGVACEDDLKKARKIIE